MSVPGVGGTAETFEMGRVLRRAFRVIARNPALFLGLAAVLQGLPQLVSGLWRADVANVQGAAPAIAFVLGKLLSFLGSTVLQVAVTRATVGDLVGEHPGFAACLKVGVALVLPTIGLTILGGLGIAAASFLLIVPGVMLYVAWSVAVPAYVQERIGIFASFDRSRGLTKGARWKIFAILLVWWIVAVLLQAPVGLLMAAAHAPGNAQVLTSTAVDAVTSMVLATVRATIYVELRDVKEGVSPKDLETIFA